MSNGVVTYDPTNFGELEIFAKRVCGTGFIPQAFRGKPDEIIAAVLLGSELGLRPLSALSSIAVINGRPAVWGDALPGLALSKGLIKDIRERFEGEPYQDGFTAVCDVERPNGTMVTQRFSVADAKRAGLWEKAGPWKQYSRRMLQIRARAFAIRDAAPHLLFGNTAEELQDIDVSAQPRGPDAARDITPPDNIPGPRASADAALQAAEAMYAADLVDGNGVVHEDDSGEPDFFEQEREPQQDGPDPLHLTGLSAKDAIGALELRINQADAKEGDRLLALYRDKLQKAAPNAYKTLELMVAAKIEGKA